MAMVALFSLTAAAAQAQDRSWLEQASATGSWGGARERIVAAGITPAASYTTDLLANPVGGAKQGFAYAGQLEASLELNLETGVPLVYEIGAGGEVLSKQVRI